MCFTKNLMSFETILFLPNEIIDHMFSFMDYRTLFICLEVNKLFNELITFHIPKEKRQNLANEFDKFKKSFRLKIASITGKSKFEKINDNIIKFVRATRQKDPFIFYARRYKKNVQVENSSDPIDLPKYLFEDFFKDSTDEHHTYEYEDLKQNPFNIQNKLFDKLFPEDDQFLFKFVCVYYKKVNLDMVLIEKEFILINNPITFKFSWNFMDDYVQAGLFPKEHSSSRESQNCLEIIKIFSLMIKILTLCD